MTSACWKSIFLFAIVTSVGGCTLEPKAPTWDVEYSIPLLNRKYTLGELVARDTSLLSVGANNQIIFNATTIIPPTLIGDSITIDVPDTSASVDLGPFVISPVTSSAGISFPWLPGGTTTIIPDTTVQIPPTQNTLNGFLEVTFESGVLTLSFQNNLPVPVTVLSPIQIQDGLGRQVATITLSPNTVQPQGIATGSDNLDGRTINNEIRTIPFDLQITGSQTPVQIPTGNLFVLSMQTSNLVVRRAELAFIPAQTLLSNDTASLGLSDSTILQEAFFRGGTLQLQFTNQVNLDLVFNYRIPQFQVLRGGQYVPFSDSISLSALGSDAIALPMAGSRIRSLDGNLVRSLDIIGSARIPAGSTSPVTINDTDKISIGLSSTGPLIIDSVSGVVKPTWISVQQSMPLDIGDFRNHFTGMLSIALASLDIDATTSTGFGVDLFLRIGAPADSFGTIVWLNVPPGSRRLLPGGGVIFFDQNEVGQFLSQISNRLPDSLIISGDVLVNPPDLYVPSLAGVGTVGASTGFRGDVTMSIPLILGIVNGTARDTVALGDSTGDGTNDFAVDRSALNNVNYGRTFIELTNGLPIQVRFQSHLLDRGHARLLSIPQGGDINSGAAQVDVQGFVIMPSRTQAVIELNDAEVSKFKPAEFLNIQFSLVTAGGGGTVRFRTTDSLRTRIWSTISLRVQ